MLRSLQDEKLLHDLEGVDNQPPHLNKGRLFAKRVDSMLKLRILQGHNNKTQLEEDVFDPDKVVFIETIELLVDAATMCLNSDYQRGVIEALNMAVRACCNCQEFFLFTPISKLLIQSFIAFTDYNKGI